MLETAVYPIHAGRDHRLGQVAIGFYLASGTAWLVLAGLFWWLSTAQALSPNDWFSLPGIAFLTYGRVFPAALNAFVFGWASLAGFGVALYFFSRFSQLSWRAGVLVLSAGAIWNLTLGLGLWHVLGGGGTGRELLDINPKIATGFLLAAGLLAVWLLTEFWSYRNEIRYIPLWHLLAAILFFLWVFTTGEVLVNLWHTGGPAQAAIHSWYVNGIYQLWLVPLALGATYALVPEGAERPMYSLRLSLIAFWGYNALAVWAGLTFYLGGPFPAWMQTVTIVANVLLLIPVLAHYANVHQTLRGRYGHLAGDLPLRFAVLGFFAFVAGAFWTAFGSFRVVDSIFHFTLAAGGRFTFLAAGFVTFTLMGAIYHAVPRLLDRRWLAPGLMRLQFWASVIGLACLALAQFAGGLIQGYGLADPKIDFTAVVNILEPFLLLQVVAVGILFLSYLMFAASLVLVLVLRVTERRSVVAPKAGALPSTSNPATEATLA